MSVAAGRMLRAVRGIDACVARRGPGDTALAGAGASAQSSPWIKSTI